jgi:TPR repeat protein
MHHKFLNDQQQMSQDIKKRDRYLNASTLLQSYYEKTRNFAMNSIYRLADEGYPPAQYQCGLWCLNNEIDFKEKAFQYFNQASLQGYAIASLKLASIFEKTNKWEDQKIAASYYLRYIKQRAENLSTDKELFKDDRYSDDTLITVLMKVGKHYITKPPTDLKDSDKRKEIAFSCFDQAVRKGCKQALYYLALCYEAGYGTIPDAKRALSLMEQSSAAGDSRASAKLLRQTSSNSISWNFFGGKPKYNSKATTELLTYQAEI